MVAASARSGSGLHTFFFVLLYTILGLSLSMLVLGAFSESAWRLYHGVYFTIIISYTWYTAILLLIGETKNEKFQAYTGQKIAVLVPNFNEDPKLFQRSLLSVVRAEGNKEIFVIDDGSVTGIGRSGIIALTKPHGVKVHFFEQNKGKRHALHHGVTHMLSDHEFVVTIDSDTVLDRDALVQVVRPLANPKVGASTGDIRLLNEKQNLLTRMIGAYYWIGLNIFKQAQSNLGMVVCCSGCLAAYRTDVLKSIIDEFMIQEFLGEECTHSEDRHLTNLVLRSGYDVKYAPRAISFTHTPATLPGFLRQQQRWKRGYIRESTFTLTYALKARPLLFFQTLLCELTMPFFAFGLMIALILSIIVDPMLFVQAVVPSWLIYMFVRYIYIIFYGRTKIPGLILYAFIYELFLYWQFIYALFTVRNKRWLTRGESGAITSSPI